MTFLRAEFLLLFPLVPAVFFLVRLRHLYIRSAVELFHLNFPKFLAVRSWILGLVCLLLVLVLAGPALEGGRRSVPARNGLVIFVVDVSNSMLSRDLTPSRLGRAQMLMEDALKGLRGDKVALVAFAGHPVVKVPLTRDYGYFLSAVSVLGPHDVPRGGTNIGDAIRYCLEDVLAGEDPAQALLVVMTDGDDQESFPLEAAEKAAGQGVSIVTMGMGTPGGAEVQDGSGKPLLYQGQPVVSELNQDLLTQIGQKTQGGGYYGSHRGNDLDMARIYEKHGKGRNQIEVSEEVIWNEISGYLLLLAFLLLVLDEALRRFSTPQGRSK